MPRLYIQKQADHNSFCSGWEDVRLVPVLLCTMEDRLNYLDKVLGDSADKHAQEIAALKAAHAAHIAEFTTHVDEFGSAYHEIRAIKDAHSKLDRDLDSVWAAREQHSSLPERISNLEQRLGDSSGQHARELHKLKLLFAPKQTVDICTQTILW